MKKYYITTLCQASPYQGYFVHLEQFKRMLVIKTPDEKYKIEAGYTITETNKFIIVEKIFPYFVREIKTGIIFPILKLKKDNYYSNEKYISYPFGLIHTFVISEENELNAREITSSRDFEIYDRNHPSAEEFKKELLEIIARGKENMNAKLKEQCHIQIPEKITPINETEEKQKVKTLIRKFKQERKNI